MSRNIAITACAAFFSFAVLSAQQPPVLDAAQREAAVAIEAPKLPPPLPPGISPPSAAPAMPGIAAPGAPAMSPPVPGQLQATVLPASPETKRIPDLPPQSQIVPSTSLQKGKVVTSTSTSGQFIVHGNDLSLRSAFSSRCEEISGELGRLLKDRQPWALPIVVLLNSGDAAKKDGKAVSMAVSALTHGGFHLQVTVNLRPDLRPSELRAEIVRALLAERILRNQKEVSVQRPLLLPDWVYTGVLEALDYRKQDRPSTLFAAIFKSGKIFGIEEIIEASPVDMDALSKTIYQVSCCALVLALIEQPEGGNRLSLFLGSLASDPKPERELLTKAFPSFAVSPASLNKWWALQLASLSRPGISEPLTAADTLKALDEALTIRYQAKASEIPKPRPVIAIVPTPEPEPVVTTENAARPPVIAAKPVINKTEASSPEAPQAEVFTPDEPAKRSFFSRLNPFYRQSKSDEDIINEAIEEAAKEEAEVSAEISESVPEPVVTELLDPLPAPKVIKAPKSATREPLFKKWFGEDKDAAKIEPAEPLKVEAPAEMKAAEPTPAPEAKIIPPAKEEPKEEPSTEPKKPSKLNPLNWFKDKKLKEKDPEIPQAVPVDESKPAEKSKSEETPRSASLENWLSSPSAFEAIISQEVAIPEVVDAETEVVKPKKKFLGLFGGKKIDAEAAKIEAPAKADPAPEMPKVEEEPKEKAKKEPLRLGSFFGGRKKEPASESPEKPETQTPEGEMPAVTKESKPEATKESATTSPQIVKPEAAKVEAVPTSKEEPLIAAAIPLDDYAAIIKRSDRKQILQRNLVALNALQLRSAILFRPIVADYTALVMELMDGKAKDVEGRLKQIRLRSQKALDQSRAVRDQLDLHEANSTPAMSGTFADYLKLPETIRKELPPRQDPISKYLDSLDKEFSR